MENPLITIITVSYNSEEFIEESILSVINQNYKNIQYIIIDGNSTDNTNIIINKYIEKIDLYISEKDDGIYDAINKGLSYARGDLIKILNSDDKLPFNSLNYVSNFFLKKKLKATNSLIIGNTYVIDRNNQISSTINKLTKTIIGFESFNHPGWFITKEAKEICGFYSTNFKISSDFEYFLRLKKNNINVYYLNEVIACYRKGGRSSKDLIGPLEVLSIHFKYRLFFLGILVFLQHLILRIMQIIYRVYRIYVIGKNR